MKYRLKETLSPAELLERLIKGDEVIIHGDGDSKIIMDEGVIKHVYQGRLTGSDINMNFHYDSYEAVEDKWYDSIPEHGVLVKLLGKGSFARNEITAIYYYCPDDKLVKTGDDNWHKVDEVKPLTEEEIKQFLPEKESTDWRDTVSRDNPVECFVSDISEADAILDENPKRAVKVVNYYPNEDFFPYGVTEEDNVTCQWKFAVPKDKNLR